MEVSASAQYLYTVIVCHTHIVNAYLVVYSTIRVENFEPKVIRRLWGHQGPKQSAVENPNRPETPPFIELYDLISRGTDKLISMRQIGAGILYII